MGSIDNTKDAKQADGRNDDDAPRLRSTVILPDGTKPVPMGSGVISGVLGVGGMANVYEIWNAQLEDNRAVKLLHPNYTPEQKQRFQTEIKICARLHHPNIVEVHAVGEWNGLPYIEMERIKGQTLEKILADRGALPLQVCTAVSILVTRALVHAHNQEYVLYGKTYHGVIHRDLKPSNIMISADGDVKLMDFGIARPTDASLHTTDGAILGTMQYLSPEQLGGKEADVRADIYALGTVLYEMLTGVRAFSETNVAKLMMSKIRNNYKPLERFALHVPPRLRRVVHSCMAHEPDRRAGTSEQLLEELARIHKAFTAESPETAIRSWMNIADTRRTVIRTRQWAWVMPAAASVFGVLLIGGAAVWWIIELSGRPHLVPPLTNPPANASAAPDASIPSASAVTPAVSADTASPAVLQAAKPVSAGSPTTAVVLPQEPSISWLGTLRTRYGTNDAAVIFAKECERGDFAGALRVFDSIPAQQAGSPLTALLRLRALEGAGDLRGYVSALSGTPVDDGEYFLRCAREEIRRDSVGRALALVEKGLSTASRLMTETDRRRDALFLRAECYSRLFDLAPGSESLSRAMDGWFEVKSFMRNTPEHEYYRKAVSEMQRIHLPSGKG